MSCFFFCRRSTTLVPMMAYLWSFPCLQIAVLDWIALLVFHQKCLQKYLGYTCSNRRCSTALDPLMAYWYQAKSIRDSDVSSFYWHPLMGFNTQFNRAMILEVLRSQWDPWYGDNRLFIVSACKGSPRNIDKTSPIYGTINIQHWTGRVEWSNG